MADAFLAADLSSLMTGPLPFGTTYFGVNSCSMSTPSLLRGRSLTCPIDATTLYRRSKSFFSVRALVGDSTTTRVFATTRLQARSVPSGRVRFGRSAGRPRVAPGRRSPAPRGPPLPARPRARTARPHRQYAQLRPPGRQAPWPGPTLVRAAPRRARAAPEPATPTPEAPRPAPGSRRRPPPAAGVGPGSARRTRCPGRRTPAVPAPARIAP